MRKGDVVPGIGLSRVKVASISAVDVDGPSGNYVVLGTLSGAPASSNQALWRGNFNLGSSAPNLHRNLPQLLLRKGDRYTTKSSEQEVVRSLSIRPSTDPSGASRNGLGRVFGASGRVIAAVTGDRKAQGVVVIGP
jgi:hypothetical protein